MNQHEISPLHTLVPHTKGRPVFSVKQHSDDRQVSSVFFKISLAFLMQQDSVGLIALQPLGPTISGVISHPALEAGPEQRQEGRLQRVSGDLVALGHIAEKLPEVGPRSTELFCLKEKHTRSRRHAQHIKHISKKEKKRKGGAEGEIGTTALEGLLPKLST